MARTNFYEAKKEAWEYYQQWRKEKTYCPALECEVRVSLKGWYHLVGKGYKPRARNDQIRRFKLLPHAKKIIEGSNFIQDMREKKGQTFYALEGMIPVTQNGVTAPRKVRVVLIEDKNKNKIFFSILDKKDKRNRGTKKSS